MALSHKNIAQEFVLGKEKGDGSRMFIKDKVIYSYGYHFPIAIRLNDGVFLFNTDGYSVSTSRHKNMVLHAIETTGAKILLFNTNKLKEFIEHGLDSLTAESIFVEAL